jgi:hypothetical protein
LAETAPVARASSCTVWAASQIAAIYSSTAVIATATPLTASLRLTSLNAVTDCLVGCGTALT